MGVVIISLHWILFEKINFSLGEIVWHLSHDFIALSFYFISLSFFKFLIRANNHHKQQRNITTHKHSKESNTSKSRTQNGSTTHTQVSTNHTTNIGSREENTTICEVFQKVFVGSEFWVLLILIINLGCYKSFPP